jgi:hypothetical protein
LIAKYLFTGSLENRSIDNLETQKKYISMKNSQFLTRITERHFLEKIPDGKRKKCVVFLKSSRPVKKNSGGVLTKVGLCIEGCFVYFIFAMNNITY